MPRLAPIAACAALALMAGCGRPDGRALQKLACEQVATSIDLQSVGQIDALRKALGVAPGVDPLQTCRDLGVTLERPEPGSERSGQADQREGDPQQSEGGLDQGDAADGSEQGSSESNEEN